MDTPSTLGLIRGSLVWMVLFILPRKEHILAFLEELVLSKTILQMIEIFGLWKLLYVKNRLLKFLKLQWLSFSCEDKLIWMGNNLGRFSVKECYKTNFCKGRSIISKIWKKIWKLRIHERLKLVLGRMMANVIPTRDVIMERVGKRGKACPLDGEELETLFHIFY